MHQVLQTQELLEVIFSYIQSGASLAALARTCQAWSDLALDVLWKRHGGVSRLVRFIPKGVRKETELDTTKYRFSRPGDVIPSDWGKFKKYHHRIRNVTEPEISGYIWLRLSANLPNDMILFPRIQSLTCTWRLPQEVEFIQLFLGPSLRNLVFELQLPFNISYIQSICANVVQTCPHLTSFHFSFPLSDELQLPEFSNIIEDFICQCHALEDLCLPCVALTTETIRHIIRLPHLRTLVWSPESSAYPTDEDDLGFPSLVHYYHLKTETPALDSINSFLYTMSLLHPNTKIRTLCVTLALTMTETHVKKALSLIINRCDQSTLTELYFITAAFCDFGMLPLPIPVRITLHFDTLRPLLNFRNIQRLSLTNNEEYGTSCVFDDVDDDTLQVISSAWPHLTGFGLEVGGFKITFQGFLAFLKGSPNLEYVHLAADFDPTSLKCEMDELPRYPKMKTLHVQDSIVKDACRTSDLFLVLFPELENIGFDPMGGYIDGWAIVNGQISQQWAKNHPNTSFWY